MVEVTGDENKIDSLLDLLKEFGIKELVRTGRVAMVRGTGAGEPIDEESVQKIKKRRKKQS
jgi:hypothetical protein